MAKARQVGNFCSKDGLERVERVESIENDM